MLRLAFRPTKFLYNIHIQGYLCLCVSKNNPRFNENFLLNKEEKFTHIIHTIQLRNPFHMIIIMRKSEYIELYTYI